LVRTEHKCNKTASSNVILTKAKIMTQITQKQLIESLNQLKEIKPNKEWASLLKAQILAEEKQVVSTPATFAGVMDTLKFVFAPRKLTYSLATILFLFIGLFGFAGYTVPGDMLFPVKKIAEQSTAALSGQTTINKDVAKLNNRINDLVTVAKEGKTNNLSSTISEISANAKELTQNLKDSPADTETIRNIATSLKTLADVPGTDIAENSDVKDLCQTLVESQIAVLQNTTLTEEQQTTLSEIEDLYEQGEYADALEKILLNQ